MQRSLKTLAFASVLGLAALGAACGPPPPVETPPAPTAAPTVTPSAVPSAAPVVSATPSAVPSATPSAPPAVPAGPPVTATRFGEDLKRIGIDWKKPPALEKIALPDKKRLMGLFVKSMGYAGCSGCHASDSDFKTDTRNLKITRAMWSHYVADLRDAKGGTLFCDSCHNSAAKMLNRTDKKALSGYMDENYVDKLVRADQKDQACASCHGEAFEPKIIEKLWGIAAK